MEPYDRSRGGRPPLPEAERKRVIQVYLSPDQLRLAEQIGHGNRGEGIRRALEAYRPGTASSDEG